jgi:hypothetical protein
MKKIYGNHAFYFREGGGISKVGDEKLGNSP